jgi:NAD(P)-dependent dehydrogenase (short-subunit alcohol dehydrogenase family)
VEKDTNMKFKDQRIVILGGSSGLGLATARAASERGAHVVVVSSSSSRVESALEQLADSAEGHVVDLLDEDAIRRLFAEVGRFDHLVYTAGESLRLGRVAELSLDAARDALEVRIWGALTAVKHAVPQIRSNGSIVLTSGTAGPRPQAGWTIGALICSGMEGIARALALELAPIRVNVVRPGVVRTELWGNLDESARAELFRTTEEGLPLGRVGEATDVAESYLYLMDSAFSTGSIVTIDGGTVLS